MSRTILLVHHDETTGLYCLVDKHDDDRTYRVEVQYPRDGRMFGWTTRWKTASDALGCATAFLSLEQARGDV